MNENNPVKSVYMIDMNTLPKKDITPEEILEFAKNSGIAIFSPLTSLQSMANELPSNERGKLSDGYHTFDELYDHRITLFVTMLRKMSEEVDPMTGDWRYKQDIWRSRKHSDGSEWDGWFILGIGIKTGEQITYHLPIDRWDDCNFADTRLMAPEWDGHSSADVLERLKQL